MKKKTKTADFFFHLLFSYRAARMQHLSDTVDAQRQRITDLEAENAGLQWAADHAPQFKPGQEILLPIDDTNEVEMWAIRERKPCLALGRMAIEKLTNLLVATETTYAAENELYYWRYKIEFLKPSGALIIPTGAVKYVSQRELQRLLKRAKGNLVAVQ